MIRIGLFIMAVLLLFRLGGREVAPEPLATARPAGPAGFAQTVVSGPSGAHTAEEISQPVRDETADPARFDAVHITSADPRDLPSAARDGPPDTTTADQPIRKWRVTSLSIPVRTGPSQFEAIVGTLNRGDRVSVLFAVTNHWLLIQTEGLGFQGYIRENSIGLADATAD